MPFDGNPFLPPPAATQANGATGGGSEWLNASSALFAGGSPIAGAAQLGASVLGALAGGPVVSGADAQGAPQTTTSWGTFNNPFTIATGSARIEGSGSAQQEAGVTLDQRPTGPSSGARAPLIEGGAGGITNVLIVGVVAFVAVALIRRKG